MQCFLKNDTVLWLSQLVVFKNDIAIAVKKKKWYCNWLLRAKHVYFAEWVTPIRQQ
jgi:hypothetical protein